VKNARKTVKQRGNQKAKSKRYKTTSRFEVHKVKFLGMYFQNTYPQLAQKEVIRKIRKRSSIFLLVELKRLGHFKVMARKV